jgi:N-hydroxyarylamine O-acetyltransferase
MNASELERYFARIGYTGPRAPRIDVLHALTAAHTQHIPFENLDVLLGQRIDLSEAALFDKLVERRRGGYCFEQNGLFLYVLTALGFEVTPLSARSRYERPPGAIMPRTHLCLRVQAEGAPWITDVGFGNMSLTAALRFEADSAQPTPHEQRRIVREGELYVHQAYLGAGWQDLCEFTGETMFEIDREVANWYTSAHPKSHFRNRLVVARAAEGGERFTVLNNQFKRRDRTGEAHVLDIESPEQLLVVLAEHFGLRFPAGTRFELAP